MLLRSSCRIYTRRTWSTRWYCTLHSITVVNVRGCSAKLIAAYVFFSLLDELLFNNVHVINLPSSGTSWTRIPQSIGWWPAQQEGNGLISLMSTVHLQLTSRIFMDGPFPTRACGRSCFLLPRISTKRFDGLFSRWDSDVPNDENTQHHGGKLLRAKHFLNSSTLPFHFKLFFFFSSSSEREILRIVGTMAFFCCYNHITWREPSFFPPPPSSELI